MIARSSNSNPIKDVVAADEEAAVGDVAATAATTMAMTRTTHLIAGLGSRLLQLQETFLRKII